MGWMDVKNQDSRILNLLSKGYSYASCFDGYGRVEVILTFPNGGKIRASGYSEEKAFKTVLDMFDMNKEEKK